MRQWYDVLDPRAEEALDDIRSMSAVSGLEFGRTRRPDETTILTILATSSNVTT
jgi:IS5 family transposase